MARPSVLPLPDDQAKRLLVQLGAIDQAHPAGTNRAFLRDFFELVRQITGGVYGARTYIQLLKQFAAHRGPSATTVNDELQGYKARILVAGGAAPAPSPEIPVRGVRSETPSGTPTSTSEPSRFALEAMGRVGELAQLQQVEVDRLRQRAERVERQAEIAFREREEAERVATAAKAELAGVLSSRDQLQATVQQLTAALQLANDRAAAENRENMMRIDRARQEVREEVQGLREQVVEARKRIAQLETDKRQTETIVDGLRRLVNELKATPRHE
ncbi:hypothetical protein [Achromobacter sp. DH1f]|uniref:hypothetical protein n=1 Tax=Achromobacter sp. DH1f TaxID=1397275 RepID=UPI000469BAFC|nr:hypothetical protein [Achromobacter sp. DH1f]